VTAAAHRLADGSPVVLGMRVVDYNLNRGVIEDSPRNRAELAKAHECRTSSGVTPIEPGEDHVKTCEAWFDVVLDSGGTSSMDCSRMAPDDDRWRGTRPVNDETFGTTPPPATSTEIVYAFMDLDSECRHNHNWGTGPRYCCNWSIPGTDTYINGVVLTIDGDYWMGYLLEAVGGTSGVVSFVVVNLYHGRRPDGFFEHTFLTYDKPCGTFFDRTDDADHVVVGSWAVSQIYGMTESWLGDRR
jgi:hypothetical protein